MWLRHVHCQLSGWLYCTSLQKLAHWNLRDRKKSKFLMSLASVPERPLTQDDTSITSSAMLQTSSSQFQGKDQRSILLRIQNVWYEPPRIHVATGWLVPFLVAVFISKGTTQLVLQEISSWFPGASWHRDLLVDIMAIATRVSFGATTSSHQSHGPKRQMADESETSLHFP